MSENNNKLKLILLTPMWRHFKETHQPALIPLERGPSREVSFPRNWKPTLLLKWSNKRFSVPA